MELTRVYNPCCATCKFVTSCDSLGMYMDGQHRCEKHGDEFIAVDSSNHGDIADAIREIYTSICEDYEVWEDENA